MSDRDKVAVLMSTFNGKKYLQCQIDSIISQELDCDITIIVRDDGSSDGTPEYIEHTYKDIVVIRGNNIGSVSSYFELIKYAKDNLVDCTFFSLADQDDRWDSDKLQIGVNELRKRDNREPLLYASLSRLVDDNLNEIPRTYRKGRKIDFYNSIIQNFLPGHNYVMNRAMLELVADADPQKIYVHDSFILNAAVLYGGLIFDENTHTDYRRHLDNQLGGTSSFADWFIQRIKRILRGDSRKYAAQIEYIYYYFNDVMDALQIREIESFLQSRKNIFRRMQYIVRTKLYRQKRTENLAFKLLYLVGGYNNVIRD